MIINIFCLFIISIFATESIEVQKIEFLIEEVRKSNLEFVRNDKTYTSQEAASHLKLKYKNAKGFFFVRKVEVEEFINKLASQSSFTGKDYLIKQKNGKFTPTREWLKIKLKEFP